MDITLHFNEADIEYLHEKFDFENEDDLCMVVWECINTYMEM